MFNKKIFTKKKKFLISILILLALIICSNIFRKELKNSVYIVSSPLQRLLWQSGDRISGFFKMFIKIKKEREEVEKFKEKNKKLTVQIAGLKELREENKKLRKAIGIGLPKRFNLSFAQIIGKNISQDSILVNKGSKNGILKNMPVITSQKIVLGKISRVYKNFAEVMLISNKKMSFDVRIQDSSDISGMAKGKGNSKISIDLVPREKKISKGDIVITDNLGEIFPKGLLVGKVEKVEKNDVNAFQKIEVKPISNIKEIDDIFIITDQKNNKE